MNLDVQSCDRVAVVTVCQKRMDASVAVDYALEISALLERSHTEIIVDMQQVNFIDSSFLGAMVSSYKKVIAAGGSYVFCGINGAVLELLELTRLDGVFPCYASVDQARSSRRAA